MTPPSPPPAAPVPHLAQSLASMQRGAGNSATMTDMAMDLGLLAGLVGTWSNPRAPNFGYNVMPLPERGANNEANIIFKNFHYYEIMRFNSIGTVPNRGGEFEQDCQAILYDQRVFFADGPKKDVMVHAENGAWLYLKADAQYQGPYGSSGSNASVPAGNDINGNVIAPTAVIQKLPIAKQVSAPHGNSLLLVGTMQSWTTGAPTIEPVNTTPHFLNDPTQQLPAALDKYISNVSAANPLFNNPNDILQQYITANSANIVRFMALDVASDRRAPSSNDPFNPTDIETGGIVNIFFINHYAKVHEFATKFWLLELNDGSARLLYTQTTTLEFPDRNLGLQGIAFKHVDASILQPAGSIC